MNRPYDRYGDSDVVDPCVASLLGFVRYARKTSANLLASFLRDDTKSDSGFIDPASAKRLAPCGFDSDCPCHSERAKRAEPKRSGGALAESRAVFAQDDTEKQCLFPTQTIMRAGLGGGTKPAAGANERIKRSDIPCGSS